MADEIPAKILVAALTTLLREALERPETEDLGGDGLRRDLRALSAQVEAELAAEQARRALRLAESPSDSAVADA